MNVIILVGALLLIAAGIGTAVTLWVSAEIDERRWRRKFGEKP